MSTEIIISPSPELQQPALFTSTPKAAKRVLEFFTAQINNEHTRKAYLNAAATLRSGATPTASASSPTCRSSTSPLSSRTCRKKNSSRQR